MLLTFTVCPGGDGADEDMRVSDVKMLDEVAGRSCLGVVFAAVAANVYSTSPAVEVVPGDLITTAERYRYYSELKVSNLGGDVLQL